MTKKIDMTDKIDLSTLKLPLPINSETFLRLEEEFLELNDKLQASKGLRKAFLKTVEGRRFLDVGAVLLKNKALLEKEKAEAKLLKVSQKLENRAERKKLINSYTEKYLGKKIFSETKRVSKYSYMQE